MQASSPHKLRRYCAEDVAQSRVAGPCRLCRGRRDPLYVVTDICAHVLGAGAPRGRRRVRAEDCLRYCLRSRPAWLGHCHPLRSSSSTTKIISRVYPPTDCSGISSLILKIIPFILVLLAYPLILGLHFLGRRYRGGGPVGMFGVGARCRHAYCW